MARWIRHVWRQVGKLGLIANHLPPVDWTARMMSNICLAARTERTRALLSQRTITTLLRVWSCVTSSMAAPFATYLLEMRGVALECEACAAQATSPQYGSLTARLACESLLSPVMRLTGGAAQHALTLRHTSQDSSRRYTSRGRFDS